MPSFRYIALTAGGERTSGVLGGASEQAVLNELERRRLIPVELKVHKGSEADAASTGEAERSALVRVKSASLAQAYGQMGDLLRAGVPLLRTLRLMAEKKADPKLGAVFKRVSDAVQDGRELASAMGEFPRVFRPVHVAMVRAGEKGGFLEQALARLAQFVTWQVELRRKILGSLVYPAFLATFGVALLIGVFAVYIPFFKGVFADTELPWLTSVVFGISTVIRGWWAPVTLLLGLSAAAGWWAMKVGRVRERAAGLVMRTPGVGAVVRSLAVARFCRMLGTLLGNGVPVLTALEIAKGAAGLPAMERSIEEAMTAVRAGQTLEPPLRGGGLFSADVLEMISVAESANNLDEVLLTIAETIEKRIDHLLTSLVRLIEPLLLLVLGLTIVLVAVALILPMFQLTAEVDIS